MNSFNHTVNNDSISKYNQAREDLLKALASFDKLTDTQKKALFQELLGFENFVAICNILRKINI